jgi:NitT/TauT family transport system ATP-binding protein
MTVTTHKVQAERVTKVYVTRQGPMIAVQDLSLEMRHQHFVCLLGPSGCGKSTLLSMIAGFVMPTSGRILVDGQPVTGPGRDRGVVFQEYVLFPWRTARQNVEFGPLVRRVPPAERQRVAERYLAMVGLAEHAQKYPRELSGGMKQRVAIARALTNQPKLLLMDEPFGALDAQTREEMQEMLLLLSAHEQTSTLFVTHDVEEAVYLSTRILVFSARPGRIQQEIAVPFGDDRPLSLKNSAGFSRLKREILDLLRAGQPSSFDRRGLLRKLTRKDSVEPVKS